MGLLYVWELRSRWRAGWLAAAVCVFCGCVAYWNGCAPASEFGGPGQDAGQLRNPRGVTVDQLTGDVYVADEEDDRVDQFTAGGVFIRAWGWDVNKDTPEEKFQVCTSGSGCQIGKAGSGVGELDRPGGIVVGSGGVVYVIDSGNNRMQEFSAEGEFLGMSGGHVNETTGGDVCSKKNVEDGDMCQSGSEGSGDGEFTNFGRQGAIAVSAGGAVFVGDKQRVQEFSAEGEFVTSFPVVAVNQVEALAVTSTNKVCLTINPSTVRDQESPLPEVRCYSTSGVLEHTIMLEEHSLTAAGEVGIWLTADGSGGLFVDDFVRINEGDVTTQSITRYSEAFDATERFAPPGGDTGSIEKLPGGLALVEAGKVASSVEVGFAREGVVRSEPVPPVGPVVESEEAHAEPAGCVTFEGSVNPELAKTGYQFAYGIGSPSTLTSEGTIVAEGLKAEAVAARVCGLKAGQVYHYHVVAKNSNGTVDGPEATVETLPPTRIESLGVGDVSESGVTLEAEVNPLGSETEYHFEYAPKGGAFTATGSVDIGAGVGGVRARAHLGGLAAYTIYVYRVIAHNLLGEARSESEFETQRAGAPPRMLDDRVWEQVSPAQKHSAAVTVINGGGVAEAAASGAGVTYYARTASEAEPEGEPIPEDEQILSRHEADGWASKDIATGAVQRDYELHTAESSEYWLFSEDLGRAVVEPNPYTAFSQWTVERTPYVREQDKCAAPVAAGSECFTPLLTNTGPFADVENGIVYGGPPSKQIGYVNTVGGTPDLSHIVLMTTQAELQKGAGTSGLYEWDAGNLSLLSIPVGGGRCDGAMALGVAGGVKNLGLDWRNALSPNGSLAVWSNEKGAGACSGHVYLRDMERPESVQVDALQGGSGAGVPAAEYQDASVGDEHVFFSDSQRLTADSSGTQAGLAGATETAADLYEYAFDLGAGTGRLVDMTVPVHAGEAAAVQGVLGAGDDGQIVYVVARGVLSEAANAQGQVAASGDDNLYMLQRGSGSWSAQFIASLSSEDSKDWTNAADEERVAEASARVSPDGRWLAFMSDRSLTGYDNRDRVSGVPDEEVFLFGASRGLVCASCNPTGARPTGVLINDFGISGRPPLVDAEKAWEGRWLSGSLPVRYAIGVAGELGIYQPRYLSDGGRLFFDSTDALVPQDVNGTVDVYEYEPPLDGEIAASDSCSEASATFAAAADGCISLISVGSSSEESVFLDASEGGDDVFFLTSSQLAGSDTDSAYDVYDAHSCGAGASWACASAPPTPVASCESGVACKEPSSSSERLAAGPASETLEGSGNVPDAPPEVKGQKASSNCPRGKHRQGKRCVKTKKHARKGGGSRAKGARSTSRAYRRRERSTRSAPGKAR